MTAQLRNIMRDPITISSRVSVTEAARLMKEKDIGWLIVTSGPSPIGIVTERDLVNKVMAAGLFTDSTYVVQVMSSKLVVGTPKMTVDQAVDIMSKHGIRRLPVVDGEKLVGIVTTRDIMAEQAKQHQRARRPKAGGAKRGSRRKGAKR